MTFEKKNHNETKPTFYSIIKTMLTYQGAFFADKMDGGGPVLPLALVLDADVPEGQQPLPLHSGARCHLSQVIRNQLFLQVKAQSYCLHLLYTFLKR